MLILPDYAMKLLKSIIKFLVPLIFRKISKSIDKLLPINSLVVLINQDLPSNCYKFLDFFCNKLVLTLR